MSEPLGIADHGLIGDLRSCALVGVDGTIDWFCPTRFDAPSVFAAILDESEGGRWELAPAGGVTRNHQFYYPDTAVLITRFLTRGLPGDIVSWSKARDEIYDRIMTKCWNDELQAFTRVEGGSDLDAGVLLMPMLKFLSPADPRFLSTLDAVERHLVTDSLVFRYDPGDDGLDGDEGTFSICSFWYVEALTRAGRLEDARLALEKMFTYANHVGLYAEQVSGTGEQVGNFPQAFTHLALISAAINLDRAPDGDGGTP